MRHVITIQKNRFRQLKKNLRGLKKTALRNRKLISNEWWDSEFYIDSSLEDRKTIFNSCDAAAAAYHYASIELLISKYFFEQKISADGLKVLDIGSGSGHWLDFYESLGFGNMVGVDVSEKSIEHLRSKYKEDREKTFYKGTAKNYLMGRNDKFDVINAIGVMFHIVDDREWLETIKLFADHLTEDGVIVIGGFFGALNNIDVQFGADGSVNKRLRSAKNWKEKLSENGLKDIKLVKNVTSLEIDHVLPENNLIFARFSA